MRLDRFPVALDSLPWKNLARPLMQAEDTLARLDERLRSSPIREGWIARAHFSETVAAMNLMGELVALDDLVLHDAEMDIHVPTPEIVRAEMVLRARRRVANGSPGWALSVTGLAGLTGRTAAEPPAESIARPHELDDEADDMEGDFDDDDWDADFAAVDTLIRRTDRILSGDMASTTSERSAADPVARPGDAIDAWRRSLAETAAYPPVLAAALAFLSWEMHAPAPNQPWLGLLLTSALLRERGKTGSHMASLAMGLKALPFERRRSRNTETRLIATIEAFSKAAEIGLRNHDRWLLARQQLERSLVGRRSNSSLPALVELVMAHPIVTAELIASRLRITPRAALGLIAELNIRETTGRSRYRAWGVI